MPNYLTPGVYVEEVSTGTKPIGMVGTSTAAFIGLAPQAQAHVNKAIPISNWSQFVREFAEGAGSGNDLARSVFGYFQNGGSRCYVVNLGSDGNLDQGLGLLEALDEVAIVCAPGAVSAAAYDAVLSHCEKLGDRVAILDSAPRVESLDQLTKVAEVSMNLSKGENAASGSAGMRPRASDGGYGAFYYPNVLARDPIDGKTIAVTPPSGHIAGVYARTDATRGVHKAPANEVVRGAIGLAHRVTREEQAGLNVAGVNVIRMFPDSGVRIWGARTLAPEASEWRYVNVRRLVNMIKESIENGTRWAVFEPNDMTLWKSVERNVRAFLTQLWRDGALLGSRPEEAFYVKCDDETNPVDVRDAGRLVTEIGIAPVKPAEFVVFRLGMMRPDSSEDSGR